MKYFIYFFLIFTLVNAFKINTKKINIYKFGGKSLSNSKKIINICKIINNEINNDIYPIIVLSAIGETTNTILNYNKDINNLNSLKDNYNQILNELELNSDVKNKVNNLLFQLEINIDKLDYNNLKSLDHLQSFGERISVKIISGYLNKLNINSIPINSWNIGIRSDSNFGNAKLLDSSKIINSKINKLKKNNLIPVITGFISKDKYDQITTLGRGGSDLIATYIASCIKCNEIQLWKDVNGMRTSDPKIISNTKKLNKISYDEATELAYFGSKILHPTSICPILKSKIKIPIKIKNTNNISCDGTLITNCNPSKKKVTAITMKSNITLIDIVSTRMVAQSGFLAKIFNIFENSSISVDTIATSEVSVSLTLDSFQILNKNTLYNLKKYAFINVKYDKAIVSFISNKDQQIVLSEILLMLNKNKIKVEMISQGASKINICLVVPLDKGKETMKLIHEKYII